MQAISRRYALKSGMEAGKEQLPTPLFWPGEFHGQRSLAAYSPWGFKDTTEQLSLHFT